MSYWETPPDRRLARYVECNAFSSDPTASPDSPALRVLPDGCVDLLLGFSHGAVRAELFGMKTRARLVRDSQPVEKLAASISAAPA